MISIGIGAVLGTLGRYFLNLTMLETGYPFGTILENLTGSFILGFLTAWFSFLIPREWLKVGLGVGLCGSFTTMSTLAADATFLFYTYTPFQSALYVFGSMFGGVLLALIGFLVGSILAKKYKHRRKEVT